MPPNPASPSTRPREPLLSGSAPSPSLPCRFSITAIFFHQVSILGSQGLSPQVASRVFAISAVSMVAFMPVFGRLLDRLPTQPVFAGGLLLISGAVASLSAVSSVASAIAFAILFGIANACSHNLLGFIWPRFFGRKHLGSIQGTSQMVSVVGASVGPIPVGMAYDLSGSYSGALIALAVLPVVCAVAVFFVREPGLLVFSLSGPSEQGAWRQRAKAMVFLVRQLSVGHIHTYASPDSHRYLPSRIIRPR